MSEEIKKSQMDVLSIGDTVVEPFIKLEKVKRLDKFPVQYKNQVDVARSLLVADKDYDKIDSNHHNV